MKKRISLLIVVLMVILSFTSAWAIEIDEDKFDQDIEFMKKVIYFVLDNISTK